MSRPSSYKYPQDKNFKQLNVFFIVPPKTGSTHVTMPIVVVLTTSVALLIIASEVSSSNLLIAILRLIRFLFQLPFLGRDGESFAGFYM